MDTKPELVQPLLAVNGWKQDELVRVQAAILRAGLDAEYISANDIPADIVSKADAQGVKSNAWSMLRALEIIERVPMALTIPAQGIFGGRTMNRHPSAKGRYVAVYKVTSRPLAEAWLTRHAREVKQEELAL